MKIANIVTTNKITVNSYFNVVKSMDEIIHGLPTLIIGFSYVNENYPDFDVCEIKIKDNLYWTCNQNEGRDKHREDLHHFIYLVFMEWFNKTTYVFVDPIQYDKKKMLKIVKKIYTSKNKITYLHDKMFYIYTDYLIFGVDLTLLNYMGLNVDKIKNKIISLSSVFLQDEDIFIEDKTMIEEFNNQIRYTPFLYFIRHEQNDFTSIIHIS